MKVKQKFSVSAAFKKAGPLILLVILCILCSFLSKSFLKRENIFNIIKQMTPVLLIAIGESFLIIAGLIDLSAGLMVALSGVIASLMFNATGSLAAVIAVCLAIGITEGLIEGYFVTRFKLPPFMVTLGTQMIAGGLALFISKGATIKITAGDAFKHFGQGAIAGIPNLLFVVIVFYAAAWFVLNRTSFGRYLYAVGGNEEAARASGVSVNQVKCLAFVISGALAAFGGVILASRLNSGSPNVGDGYEFDAIIGAVLGGASMSGGIGTITGTLIGCFIIGVMNNAMNLLNISPYLQDVAKGLLILIAVTIDAVGKMGKSAVKSRG